MNNASDAMEGTAIEPRAPQSVPSARPVPTAEQLPAAPAKGGPTQQQVVTWGGYALLVVVVGIAASMSWTGLVGFGKDTLHLSGVMTYGVPVSLDVAAMLCGFLALRSVVSNDSAAGPRMLTFLLVGGSAAANYYHADHMKDGSTQAALYFGAMSILSWFLWDVVLRQIRRGMLRSIGAVERPLARFRLVRWMRYPRETFAAWSLSVRYGVTRPDDALQRVWDSQQQLETVREIEELEALQELPEGISKREAVEMAFKALGSLDVKEAIEWCGRRGVTVDRSYVYEIAKKIDQPSPRPLMAAS